MKKLYGVVTVALTVILINLPHASHRLVEASTSHNLTYQLYGGSNHPDNPTSYLSDAEDVILNPATKPGLSFYGWYKSEAFREIDRVDSLPGNHAGVEKLYAKWGQLSYPVTLNTNGGEAIAPQRSMPVFTLNTTPTFSETSTTTGGYVSVSRDLNNDGYGDFITFNGGNRTYYYSNGSGGFTETVVNNTILGGATWNAMFADINGDNLEDLIVIAETSGNPVSYSLRQPNGSLGPETRFTLTAGGVNYSSQIGIDMADLDGDGDLDLILSTSGMVIYRLYEGNFTFGPAVQVFTFSGYGRGVAVFDFDQDGYLDVLGTGNDNGFIKFGNAAGIFGGTLLNLGHGPYRPFISDLTRDGAYDLLGIASNFSGSAFVDINPDQSKETRAFIPGTGTLAFTSWNGDSMDVNGDGYTDLFYSGGSRGSIISNGDGTYRLSNYASSIDAYTSGTLVHNPINGTIGIMGINGSKVAKHHALDASQSVSHLASLNPTRPGYTFGGWYENEDLTGTAFNFNTPVTSAITLHAKWTAATYTITYTLNGGTNNVSNPSSFNIASATITLQNPTRSGYRFDGWFDNSIFTGNAITIIPTGSFGNKQLFAKWTFIYSIDFNSNGGSSVSQILAGTGETIVEPITPTKVGHTFGGWYSDAGLIQPFTFGVMPGNNVQLFAKWTINSYTVTFETNGGNIFTSTSYDFNSEIVEPIDPVREGHTFLGWFEDEALTIAWNTYAMPSNDFTLYAKWSINSYIIQFESNGGSSIDDLTFDFDETITLPTNPTRLGYTFGGWFTDEGLEDAFSLTSMPSENLDLFAKWLVNTYTITFDTDGGSTISPLDIDFTDSITLPSNPVKEGHMFEGWFTDELLEEAFTLTTMPAESFTLYAKWSINSYEVEFEVDGDNFATVSVNFNDLIVPPQAPTKDGFEFIGWSYEGELVDFTTFKLPASAITLVAVFRDNVAPLVTGVENDTVYEGEVTIEFNEGTATLNGEVIVSGTVITKAGTYTLRVTDAANNVTEIEFTIEAQTNLLEIAGLLTLLGVALATILFIIFRKKKKDGDKTPPQTSSTKAKSKNDQPLKKAVSKAVSVKPISTTLKKTLTLKTDLVEELAPDSKKEFDQVFVSPNRAIKVEELIYQPGTTNIAFFSNLFTHIHKFASVISATLLGDLTQTVLKHTDNKQDQLSIINASTQTAEKLVSLPSKEYLLKLLRRNVALHRDVINPRGGFIYSYQRLADLLEELGYLEEAFVLVKEAVVRNLEDTPDTTFEKRLNRVEKALAKAKGKRLDMVAK